MLTNLKKVIEILDELAPFELAEKWDNSGLQIGSHDLTIKKALIALDPTLEAVRMAVSKGAQLLITHHPLLFRGISCIDFNLYPGDVIREAIKNDIAVIATHTNLDCAKTGINHHLAKKIRLVDVEILEPKELHGEKGYGLGVIGNLPEPADLFSVTLLIKKALEINNLKVIGSNESLVKRIAVVGGSGRDLISASAGKNADLLITGDIGHHDALMAKTLNINVIDAGHFSTERAALKGFIKNLKELFDKYQMNITLELYEDETDPVRII